MPRSLTAFGTESCRGGGIKSQNDPNSFRHILTILPLGLKHHVAVLLVFFPPVSLLDVLVPTVGYKNVWADAAHC